MGNIQSEVSISVSTGEFPQPEPQQEPQPTVESTQEYTSDYSGNMTNSGKFYTVN